MLTLLKWDNMIIKLIKSIFKSPKQGFLDIYRDAKNLRPGKSEKEYFKLLLLTKPPFDYQLDTVIEFVINEYNLIEDLSDFVTEISKDDCLWENRTKNLKIYRKKLEERNRLFFKEFWS